MSNFEKCLVPVLEVEKGFVDHPLDKGGPTNLGITQATLSEYLGRPATVADIQALTPDAVSPIYRSRYWDTCKLDEFPLSIAKLVFNQAVLRGPAAAVKSLQRALGVTDDGIVGPKTIAKAKMANERALAFNFLHECHDAYIRICQANPSQLVFLAGWSNRIFALLAEVLRS